MLSKDKTSFVLYTSFYEALADLPLDRKGMLLDLIFQYEIHGDTDVFERHFTDLPNDVKMAFRFIKGQLDKDQSKWKEVCAARSKNGKRGADSRWGGNTVQTDANADNDSKNNKDDIKMAKMANAKFAINIIAKDGKAISQMAKMADNEYDNEYENDVVVNTTTARARVTTAPPTLKKIESYRKSLANKFYIKGEDDAFCRVVLKQAREFNQQKIQEMANGVTRNYTVAGEPVWEWSQRVDIAVGYRVWMERIVAAWDAGKYEGKTNENK